VTSYSKRSIEFDQLVASDFHTSGFQQTKNQDGLGYSAIWQLAIMTSRSEKLHVETPNGAQIAQQTVGQ
jgi:hypothetical protein